MLSKRSTHEIAPWGFLPSESQDHRLPIARFHWNSQQAPLRMISVSSQASAVADDRFSVMLAHFAFREPESQRPRSILCRVLDGRVLDEVCPSDAMVLTPIAPHTLTNRPVVIPAASEVHVRPIMEGSDEVYVTFDGQSGFPLQPDDLVSVRRAPHPLRIVKSASRTYFDVLREKLKWGGDNR